MYYLNANFHSVENDNYRRYVLTKKTAAACIVGALGVLLCTKYSSSVLSVAYRVLQSPAVTDLRMLARGIFTATAPYTPSFVAFLLAIKVYEEQEKTKQHLCKEKGSIESRHQFEISNRRLELEGAKASNRALKGMNRNDFETKILNGFQCENERLKLLQDEIETLVSERNILIIEISRSFLFRGLARKKIEQLKLS